MYKFTDIDKFNAIVKDSKINVGINPVAELAYGKGISRLLVHFPVCELSKLSSDGTFAHRDKIKHVLHIRNCGNVDYTQIHDKKSSSFGETHKLRACSFDIIFFRLPCDFDGGKGFDYEFNSFNRGFIRQPKDLLMDGSRTMSEDGVNWFQPRNGYYWTDYENGDDGVYSNEFLSKEYDKFAQGEESVVLGRQHFDIGWEDIDFDLTDYVENVLSGVWENHGIGIAFSPMTELKETEYQNYIAFFTHKTNTIFVPQVRTHYTGYISDDRACFALGKTNKLYLYCNINGNLENLDELPVCSIDGKMSPVSQEGRGIYAAEVKLDKDEYQVGQMVYDEWSNLKYQGDDIEDVELYFTPVSANRIFSVGSRIEHKPNYVAECSGIKDDEEINAGDVRKLVVNCRVPYTREQSQLVDKLQMRLYVKDGMDEIDIIPFDGVEKSYQENYYMIDTKGLKPQNYFVDVKFMYNGEQRVQKNIVHFKIVNNATKRYF